MPIRTAGLCSVGAKWKKVLKHRVKVITIYTCPEQVVFVSAVKRFTTMCPNVHDPGPGGLKCPLTGGTGIPGEAPSRRRTQTSAAPSRWSRDAPSG